MDLQVGAVWWLNITCCFRRSSLAYIANGTFGDFGASRPRSSSFHVKYLNLSLREEFTLAVEWFWLVNLRLYNSQCLDIAKFLGRYALNCSTTCIWLCFGFFELISSSLWSISQYHPNNCLIHRDIRETDRLSRPKRRSSYSSSRYLEIYSELDVFAAAAGLVQERNGEAVFGRTILVTFLRPLSNCLEFFGVHRTRIPDGSLSWNCIFCAPDHCGTIKPRF